VLVDIYPMTDDMHLLREAAGFVTPAQLEALRILGAQDLAERQRQMAARRASLGTK
jgi:hypothetical protein